MPKGPFPPETVTKRRTRSVTFSRDLLRYAYEGPTWTNEVTDFAQQSYVTVCNGKESKSYYGNAYGKHPLGFLHKENNTNMDADNLRIQPILRHFRPLHGSLGRMSSSRAVLRAQEGIIGNQRCVIVDQDAPGGKESFWFDPTRDFIILRIQRDYGAGKAFEQLDISYSFDNAHSWVPSGWRGVWKYSFDNGKTLTLKESFEARVDGYQINFPFRSEEFEFSFPPGTFVEDQRTPGEAYIADFRRA